jgi:ornithine cyclodeaminase
MSFPFRLLTEDDVKALLPSSEFPALVDLMEATLRDFSSGRSTQPVRSAVPIGPPGQYLGVMPAMLAGASGLGTKLVSVVPGNASRGVSTHLGIVALFDPVVGALVAILDARYITEVRTAAVSAVSARRLARPDATRLAVIGTGVQARSHLEALAATRRLTAVHAWGPDRRQLDEYARDMSRRAGLPVTASDDAESAVRGADIVVLATSSASPVVRSEWIGDGTHVISVGACRPDQREMDPALVARARVIVDSRAAALVESGDIVRGMAEGRFGPGHLAAELGEVVVGVAVGRQATAQVTVFKSLGLAVEDVATATVALRRAEARGLGTVLSL